jgi:hypothetical protein
MVVAVAEDIEAVIVAAGEGFSRIAVGCCALAAAGVWLTVGCRPPVVQLVKIRTAQNSTNERACKLATNALVNRLISYPPLCLNFLPASNSEYGSARFLSTLRM